MRNARRKLGTLLILAAVAVPLAVVSIAYACGVLATLHLSARSAAPGATILGIGHNYNTSPKASPVVLRFNSRNGPVLWSGRPNANGVISPSFTVPSVRSGYYVINAMQTNATGAIAAGTPGRAALRIGSGSSAKGAAAPWPSGTPGSGAGSYSSAGSSTPALSSGDGLLVGALSAGLLAGGALLLLGDRRRGRRSAPVV
jgi:hypothetical protein